MRKILGISLMLVAAATLVAYQIRRNEKSPREHAGEAILKAAVSKSAAMPGGSIDASALPPSRLPALVDPADREFQDWLELQARQIDNPKVDSSQVQAEMNRKVSRLTSVQTRQLLRTVQSKTAKPSEKILSTYLLVEAGPRALQELKELITAPAQTDARADAHSEQEMESVREKTLKIMALDGLASRAQSDPMAREALAKAIAEAQDPYVRRYAQEQMDRLSRQ